MKQFLLLIVFFLFYNCGDEVVPNSCFNGIRLNEVVNLNTPQFVDLQVPTGDVTVLLGGRNVLIIKRNERFQAFDMECPEKNCTTPMTFDGLKIKCSCDAKEYNYLQGGAPIDNDGCFALEYNVTVLNSASLQISR